MGEEYPWETDEIVTDEGAIAHLRLTHPRFAQLIDQTGPCGLSQSQHTGDLLTCLTRTIIHQQLSIRAAATIHGRFLALYPGQSPTAADILNTSEQTLREAGLSRAKVGYVKDLAAKVESGLPTLEQLATQDDDAIIQTLTQVKGIGRWSVQMLLIFRLQRQDVWPTDDQGIRNALQRLYQLDERPGRAATETLGRPWQPYRSIAAWYLWRSLAMDEWG